MDYGVFEKQNNYPVTLNMQEIEQPFLVLQTFLASTSKEQLHQDFNNLLYAHFKPNKWREFGAPAYLYGTYRRLIKLMDILWLIAQCYKNKTSKSWDSFDSRNLNHHYNRSFRNLFVMRPMEMENIPEEDSLVVIIRFFEEGNLTSWRNSMESWTEVALSSSYMRNSNLDFFVTECGMVREYRMITELIDAAYRLKTLELNVSTVKKLNMYKLFAIEVDYPASFEAAEIYDPSMVLSYPFYYMDVQRIPHAISVWYEMLSSTDHWQYYDDPGNIIYFKNTLVEQIEASWLLLQDYDLSCFLQVCKQDVAYSFLNAQEYAYPFQVIEHFFELQGLSDWKQLIEEWAYGSLTDKKEEELLNSKITKNTCKQLIKLIQALSLINTTI